MSKKQHYQHKFIEDARDAEKDYKDKNFENFSRLLIGELLYYIKDITFGRIINNYVTHDILFHGSIRAHSLLWHYTVDLKFIKRWMTYSFRFPNVCHPDLFKIFNVKANHLFQKSWKPRHRSDDWYVYIGKQLPKYVGQYLGMEIIFREHKPSHIMLFVNQNRERLDIYFYFKSNRTKITITFEPGVPTSNTS